MPIEEYAFDLLETMIRRGAAYERANKIINDAIGEVTSEFTHGLHCIDGEIHTSACKFIDAALGISETGTTTYFLSECIGDYGHGGLIDCCGSTWELRNLKGFRDYIEHCKSCGIGKVLKPSPQKPE